MPLVPALWRKRQADVCELEVSLIYRASLRTATKRNPVSQQPAFPSLSQLGGQCVQQTHVPAEPSQTTSNHVSSFKAATDKVAHTTDRKSLSSFQ